MYARFVWVGVPNAKRNTMNDELRREKYYPDLKLGFFRKVFISPQIVKKSTQKKVDEASGKFERNVI